MTVKKGELPWSDLRFKSKTQINQMLDAWCLSDEIPKGCQKDVPGWTEECFNLLEITVLTRQH